MRVSSSASIFSRAASSVPIGTSPAACTAVYTGTRRKMKESPAERMHNRILNGSAYSTKNVTTERFKSVAQQAGTLDLPDVKRALNRLEAAEKMKVK
jgi:hypothetical protein